MSAPERPRLHLPANPGGLVYGTILVATLLSVETVKRQTYPKTVASVAIGLMVYWLAASYADYAGERAHHGEHFHVGGFLQVALHEIAVVFGAVVPLLVLLACWATGVSLEHAVTSAIWTAIGLIVLTEVVLGLRSDLGGHELIVQSAFGVVMGLLVIVLRVVVH